MMLARDFLTQMARAGIRLSVEGAHIRAEPRSRLTDQRRAAIRAHRAVLVELLAPKVLKNDEDAQASTLSTFGVVEHLREQARVVEQPERPSAGAPDLAERAAIIERDGGYFRAVAERHAGEGWNAYDWRRWHGEILARYRRVDTEVGAQSRAYGAATYEWHARHGARATPGTCAGCGKPIEGRAVLALPAGAAVHGDGLGCLTAYGRRWRPVAQDGLKALGIEAPKGWTP